MAASPAFSPEALKKAGKKPGDITVGGIDLAPATIDGLKNGLYHRRPWISCSICRASCRCPVRADDEIRDAGPLLNTGAGVVTPETIGALVPLIEKGYR